MATVETGMDRFATSLTVNRYFDENPALASRWSLLTLNFNIMLGPGFIATSFVVFADVCRVCVMLTAVHFSF